VVEVALVSEGPAILSPASPLLRFVYKSVP
jgi:hypothetical protein